MSVRIRMKKMGRRHRPFFRVCAVDSRSPRDGRVLEELGTYDPMLKNVDARADLKADRIDYWLGVGAQPSEKVNALIKKYGTDGTHLDFAVSRLARPFREIKLLREVDRVSDLAFVAPLVLPLTFLVYEVFERLLYDRRLSFNLALQLRRGGGQAAKDALGEQRLLRLDVNDEVEKGGPHHHDEREEQGAEPVVAAFLGGHRKHRLEGR